MLSDNANVVAVLGTIVVLIEGRRRDDRASTRAQLIQRAERGWNQSCGEATADHCQREVLAKSLSKVRRQPLAPRWDYHGVLCERTR